MPHWGDVIVWASTPGLIGLLREEVNANEQVENDLQFDPKQALESSQKLGKWESFQRLQ